MNDGVVSPGEHLPNIGELALVGHWPAIHKDRKF